MNIVDRYIEEKYGIKATRRNDGLINNIGTTALQCFKQNPNRVMWHLVNLSPNKMWIGFSGDVNSTKGIPLSSGSQILSLIDEDLHLVGNEIWIVASGAVSWLYAYEVEATHEGESGLRAILKAFNAIRILFGGLRQK